MLKCVPKSYGFAHVCDECGAIGPIRGDFSTIVDLSETDPAMNLRCNGDNQCSARSEGWHISEVDLCPKCVASDKA